MIALYSFGYYSEFVGSDDLDELFSKLIKKDNNSLLIRLYKKYVREDDLCPTLNLLKKSVDEMGNDKKLLKELISKFEYAIQNSTYFKKKYGHYEPVRFIILDEPYCTLSRNIPIEDYDNNDGEPFWMRPEYIIEKYGKNTYLQVNTITPTSYEHKATYKDGKLVK